MTFKLRLKELGKNIPGGEEGWCEGIAESPEARGRGGKGGRRVPEDAGKVGRGGEATRGLYPEAGKPLQHSEQGRDWIQVCSWRRSLGAVLTGRGGVEVERVPGRWPRSPGKGRWGLGLDGMGIDLRLRNW